MKRSLKLKVKQEYIVMIVVENQQEMTRRIEHHENPKYKEFKLGAGNTMTWKDYKKEASKCIFLFFKN